jgi:hypothetical protein
MLSNGRVMIQRDILFLVQKGFLANSLFVKPQPQQWRWNSLVYTKKRYEELERS